MPLTFEKSMEIATGAVNTVVPRAPRFVSDGNCSLSGQAKFFGLSEDDHRVVRLGYVVNVASRPAQAGSGGTTSAGPGGSTWPACSSYDVQLSFSLIDADGFQVYCARSQTHLLSLGESYSVRGVVDQPIPRDLADRVKRIDCRLCFHGIEVP
jgi:hypothetical protein